MNNSYLLEKYKTSLERRVEYRCYEEEKEQERKVQLWRKMGGRFRGRVR